MSERSPAFQFYFKDWRSSKHVQRMSFKERGMYLEMLIDQWDKGPLPSDPHDIATLIGAKGTDFIKSWPTLRECFSETPVGWVNLRLETERIKQSIRKQRASDDGKDGATKRWGKPSNGNGHPIATPLQPHSSSIAIASAIAIAPADASEQAKVKSLEDVSVQERAAALVERYGGLYSKHRHGARHRARPNLDWLDACDLVRTWDDARLLKLAEVVLTTDDSWITGTDRSFKIFAMKATWADDRLKAWEVQNGVTS